MVAGNISVGKWFVVFVRELRCGWHSGVMFTWLSSQEQWGLRSQALDNCWIKTCGQFIHSPFVDESQNSVPSVIMQLQEENSPT
jgi:hypothetical protein